MKKLIVITLLAASAFTGFSQTTNTQPWYYDLYNAAKQIGLAAPTNFAVAPFLDYVPSAPHKIGGGIAGIYNVSSHVGILAGVEEIGSTFYSISGQVELKTTIKPLAFLGNNLLGNIVATPFVDTGVLTALSGGGKADGGVVGIVGGGATVDLLSLWGGDVFLGGGYQYWSGSANGYNGNHYQGMFGWHMSF